MKRWLELIAGSACSDDQGKSTIDDFTSKLAVDTGYYNDISGRNSISADFEDCSIKLWGVNSP